MLQILVVNGNQLDLKLVSRQSLNTSWNYKFEPAFQNMRSFLVQIGYIVRVVPERASEPSINYTQKLLPGLYRIMQVQIGMYVLVMELGLILTLVFFSMIIWIGSPSSLLL